MSCVPYPTEFPTEAVTNVIAYIRGDPSVNINCVVHCTWNAVGYGLGLGLPAPNCKLSSRESLADALQAHLDVRAVPGKQVGGLIPWATLLAMLVQFLMTLLSPPPTPAP